MMKSETQTRLKVEDVYMTYETSYNVLQWHVYISVSCMFNLGYILVGLLYKKPFAFFWHLNGMWHFNFNKIILSTKQKEPLPLFWQNKKLKYFWRSRQYGFKLWWLPFGIVWYRNAYVSFVRKLWKMLCILKVPLQKIFHIVNDADMTFSIKYSEIQLCTLCHEKLEDATWNPGIRSAKSFMWLTIYLRHLLRNAKECITDPHNQSEAFWKVVTEI